MAERKRSHDGSRDTDAFDTDFPAPAHSGRADGEMERKVGTRDEVDRARQGEGTTRVRKSDEAGEGNLGGHHGTGEDSR